MPVPEHLPKDCWVLHSWVPVSSSPVQASGLLCCHWGRAQPEERCCSISDFPTVPNWYGIPRAAPSLSAQLRPAHPFSTDGWENVKTTNAAHSLVNERRRLNGAEIHCARVPSCPISDEPNSPPRSSCTAVGRAWPTEASVSMVHNAQQS